MAQSSCAAENGEVVAAQAALAVSERRLQALRQRGCGGATSRRDRAFRKAPDLRALGHPAMSKTETVVRPDANDFSAGRSSVRAQDFLPPFATPESTPAPTAAFFQSDGGGGGGDVAQRLAASIRGDGPHREARASSAIAPLGELSLEPVVAEALYGAGPTPRPSPAGHAALVGHRCRMELRRFCYDLLHWEEITRQDLNATGCDSKLHYVLVREGRAPFLALCALGLLCTAALAAIVLQRLLRF